MCTLKHTYSEVPIYCTNSSNSHRQRRKRNKRKRGLWGGGSVVNKETTTTKYRGQYQCDTYSPSHIHNNRSFPRKIHTQTSREYTDARVELTALSQTSEYNMIRSRVGEKTCTQNQAVLNKDLICKRVHSVHYRHWKGEEERNGRACNTSKKDYTYIYA